MKKCTLLKAGIVLSLALLTILTISVLCRTPQSFEVTKKVAYDFDSKSMENAIKVMQTDDLKIEYLVTGRQDGAAILFVHGLGANFSQFEKQHDFFGRDFQVISLNLRGHGNSSLVNDLGDADFTLNDISQDVIAVLDLLRIKKVHFVGNSMGGNVGYELMKSHPDRLLSLTTFGTTGKLETSGFKVGVLKLLYSLLSPETLGKMASKSGNTDYARQKIQSVMSQARKSTVLMIIPSLASFDYLETIRNSDVPAMIMKGEKDDDINAELDSTISAFESRGNFELIELGGVGHFANLDNPEMFNTKLVSFVRVAD